MGWEKKGRKKERGETVELGACLPKKQCKRWNWQMKANQSILFQMNKHIDSVSPKQVNYL